MEKKSDDPDKLLKELGGINYGRRPYEYWQYKNAREKYNGELKNEISQQIGELTRRYQQWRQEYYDGQMKRAMMRESNGYLPTYDEERNYIAQQRKEVADYYRTGIKDWAVRNYQRSLQRPDLFGPRERQGEMATERESMREYSDISRKLSEFVVRTPQLTVSKRVRTWANAKARHTNELIYMFENNSVKEIEKSSLPHNQKSALIKAKLGKRESYDAMIEWYRWQERTLFYLADMVTPDEYDRPQSGLAYGLDKTLEYTTEIGIDTLLLSPFGKMGKLFAPFLAVESEETASYTEKSEHSGHFEAEEHAKKGRVENFAIAAAKGFIKDDLTDKGDNKLVGYLVDLFSKYYEDYGKNSAKPK